MLEDSRQAPPGIRNYGMVPGFSLTGIPGV